MINSLIVQYCTLYYAKHARVLETAVSKASGIQDNIKPFILKPCEWHEAIDCQNYDNVNDGNCTKKIPI
jgi:hypothetical protein